MTWDDIVEAVPFVYVRLQATQCTAGVERSMLVARECRARDESTLYTVDHRSRQIKQPMECDMII